MSGQRSGQVLDEYGRGVPGAKVYVFDNGGNTALVYSDAGLTILTTQPVLTDEFGGYSYYGADGFYTEETWFGGRLRYRERGIPVGAAIGTLEDEALTRSNADAAEVVARNGAILVETNSRIAAVSAEATARATAVNTEATTRANADSAEATTRAAAVAAEVTNRALGDTNEALARANADAAILTAIHNAGGTLSNVTINAADRTILAALPTALPAFLAETAREGVFVWRTGDHTAKVAADTRQGVYVALASDPTGATGAWRRQFSGHLDLRWFGGVADCVAFGAGTDNSPAINCAKAVAKLIGNGASVLIPKSDKLYRCAGTINFTEHVQLVGQGYSENPGTVNGVTYTKPSNYSGSVLAFDADVGGIILTAYTDHAANAPVTQYQSSLNSIARDLMLIGGGGVGTTAHGIEIHVGVRMDNVRISGFAGNGLNIVCNTSGANQYGNADESAFSAVQCDANKLHGVKLDGNDANNINFFGCRFTNNGGAGTMDFTIVGCNGFYGCQWATNNRSHPTNSASGYSAAQIALVQADAPCLTDNLTGSAITYRGHDYSGNDIGNVSLYSCCYVEGGSGALARLRGQTKVIGGFLAQTGIRHSEYNADTWGVDGSITGIVNFYNLSNGFFFNDKNITLRVNSGNSIPKFTFTPATANFSQFVMQGLGGSAALGMDVTVGNATGYFSADTFILRNAAQSSTHVTIDGTGINVTAATPQIKVSGTKVVGTRQTGTAAVATDLATGLTLLNDLRAKLIAHGLIS